MTPPKKIKKVGFNIYPRSSWSYLDQKQTGFQENLTMISATEVSPLRLQHVLHHTSSHDFVAFFLVAGKKHACWGGRGPKNDRLIEV